MRKADIAEFDPEYEVVLGSIVDEIYNLAWHKHDWDWGELAANSGCAKSTVYRLGNRETVLPQLYTIVKLARAVVKKLSISDLAPAKVTGKRRAS